MVTTISFNLEVKIESLFLTPSVLLNIILEFFQFLPSNLHFFIVDWARFLLPKRLKKAVVVRATSTGTNTGEFMRLVLKHLNQYPYNQVIT